MNVISNEEISRNKLLLINPKSNVTPLYGIKLPPLQLLSLSSIKNSKIKILDLNVNQKIKKEFWSNFEYIVTTCNTSNYLEAISILKKAKKYGKTTVIGGVHTTLNYKEVITNPYVDIVVRGEGEQTFKELIDEKPLEKIKGISYKINNKVYHSQGRHLIKNLDKLPYINWSLIKPEKYTAFGEQIVGINTSRGCPHKCSFCCTPIQWRGCWRAMSPERVIEEIKRVPKGTKIIFFCDDNFCNDMERVKKICKLIIKNKLNKFKYGIEARADSLAKNPEALKLMAKSNFQLVVLGIESSNQNTLDSINKKEGKLTIKRAIKLLNNEKIAIWGTFVIGAPNEKISNMIDTIKYAQSLKIDIAQFTFYTIFPGMKEFEEDVKEKNLKKFDTIHPVTNSDIPSYKLKLLLYGAYGIYYSPLRMLKKIKYWKKNKLIIVNLIQKNKNGLFFWYLRSMVTFFANCLFPIILYSITKLFFGIDNLINKKKEHA